MCAHSLVLSIYTLPDAYLHTTCLKDSYMACVKYDSYPERQQRLPLLGAYSRLTSSFCVQGYPLRIIIPGYIGEQPRILFLFLPPALLSYLMNSVERTSICSSSHCTISAFAPCVLMTYCHAQVGGW